MGPLSSQVGFYSTGWLQAAASPVTTSQLSNEGSFSHRESLLSIPGSAVTHQGQMIAAAAY
jgi:hypothetical protein